MRFPSPFVVLLLMVTAFQPVCAKAQDVNELIKKVKAKLDAVNDYQADGVMKTDVSFMKVPESKVTIYYKKPDKFKISKQNGISIVPKGGVNINLGSLFTGDHYTAVAAGKGDINGAAVAIVKLLPLDEKSDVVVSTLYVDEKEALVKRAVITTRESGTYEMSLSYGPYAGRGLPDKVVFIFAIKDYKLPKGLAFDYDSGEKPKPTTTDANQKGKVEITYSNYLINKGINDSFFH
jgi:outer membrane lipoprotein-sorting protein